MDATPHNIRVVEAGEPDVPAISSLFWRMWDEAGPDAPGFSGATEEVIEEIAQPGVAPNLCALADKDAV